MKKSSALIAASSVFALASPAFAAGGSGGGGNGGATPPNVSSTAAAEEPERCPAELWRIADNADRIGEQQQSLCWARSGNQDDERSNRDWLDSYAAWEEYRYPVRASFD